MVSTSSCTRPGLRVPSPARRSPAKLPVCSSFHSVTMPIDVTRISQFPMSCARHQKHLQILPVRFRSYGIMTALQPGVNINAGLSSGRSAQRWERYGLPQGRRGWWSDVSDSASKADRLVFDCPLPFAAPRLISGHQRQKSKAEPSMLRVCHRCEPIAQIKFCSQFDSCSRFGQISPTALSRAPYARIVTARRSRRHGQDGQLWCRSDWCHLYHMDV